MGKRTLDSPGSRSGKATMSISQTKPIIVGIDGSQYSLAALHWALPEARRRACPIRAVLVWRMAQFLSSGPPDLGGLPAMREERPDPIYRQRLEDTVAATDGDRDGSPVSTELLQGKPAETLVSASAHAQLLVLGSHGRGRLADALVGSVAQYCVRHAHCPVVLIPSGSATAENPGEAPDARAEKGRTR
ncbi:universal stress protein [Sciscionella sediminilitoris]|uniref:universal stress protein n=1 Tax=Sciscionella sediminilitoris TaxID=1445613 RepID=UPI00068E8886|nr:universal stress protein [Sciscionella sp. SE31]